jgi:hypothetical protein
VKNLGAIVHRNHWTLRENESAPWLQTLRKLLFYTTLLCMLTGGEGLWQRCRQHRIFGINVDEALDNLDYHVALEVQRGILSTHPSPSFIPCINKWNLIILRSSCQCWNVRTELWVCSSLSKYKILSIKELGQDRSIFCSIWELSVPPLDGGLANKMPPGSIPLAQT